MGSEEIVLRSSITVKNNSRAAITITTPKGTAKLTTTFLESIVKLNNKIRDGHFGADNKVFKFLLQES